MYVPETSGRRRSFFRKHRLLLLFLLGACAFSLPYILTKIVRKHNAVMPPSEATPVAPMPEPLRPVPPAGRTRIIYPYSVIPGGVHSRDELAAAASSDIVVADHYAGFNISQARMIKAEETSFVHVSYRKQDKIFWTAKAVKIPKGETLITDGKEIARARCGNKVSASPEEPVSGDEPDVETFDIPQVAAYDPHQLVIMEQPALTINPTARMRMPPLESPFAVKRPEIIPYYYRPLFAVSAEEVVVPEPGTLGMLLGGLAILFISKFRHRG